MLQLVAKPGCCEEAALGIPFYAPCNKDAEFVVGWIGRLDKPIRMCASCADHNVRNRGGFVIAPSNLPESDSSFRLRILWSGHELNDLDKFAIATVTGKALDEIGRHVAMTRRVT